VILNLSEFDQARLLIFGLLACNIAKLVRRSRYQEEVCEHMQGVRLIILQL